MNLLKRLSIASVLMALVIVLLSRAAGATSLHASSCGGWSMVPSPNPYTTANNLRSIAAVTPTDVWAVGSGGNADSPSQPLIEHWDGTSWQVSPSPTASGGLFGLTAVSANDIWAVGSAGGLTLTEYWNGTKWSLVPSPSVGTYNNGLDGVASVSSTDVWAVGYDQLGFSTPYHTLIEHWDGSQWSIVKSPNGGQESRFLEGVTAVSSHDVWAVGNYGARRNQGGVLVEHWDGTKWSIIPAAGGNQSYLNATVALNSQYVWAVGRSGSGIVMTERWNGQHWQRAPSPDPGNGVPFSVAAHSKKDAWMVGNALNFQQGLFITMTEHWDGKNWQVVASPNVPSVDNYLYGVAATSAQEAWAVGYAMPKNGYTSTTLIEHYC